MGALVLGMGESEGGWFVVVTLGVLNVGPRVMAARVGLGVGTATEKQPM